jgi:serine protease Do
MYKQLIAITLVFFALVSTGTGSAAPGHPAASDGRHSSDSLCPAAANLQAKTMSVAPKCVASTVGLILLDENESSIGSGSGVVVSADGLVLTAAHVAVKPGTRFTLRFTDSKVVQGVSLGMDHRTDAAMVRITDAAPPGGWPFSPLAKGELQQGQWVLATGHPGSVVEGRDPPMRLGRLTGLQEDSLESTCAVEPGDSGGPLFDLSGHVVGINSSITMAGISKHLGTWRSHHVPASAFTAQWKDMLAGKEAHPEARAEEGQDEDVSDAELARIEKGLERLAKRKDAESKKLIEEIETKGDNMSAAEVARLLEKAGVLPKVSDSAAERGERKTQGIPADFRPLLIPALKHSLLEEFPEAKVTDAIMQQILDKSSFDLATGELEMSPDLEDFKTMGISEEELAKQAAEDEPTNRLSRQFDRTSLQTLSLFIPALEAAGHCVVEIGEDGKPVLLGTIVDADGWIVTKASDLPKDPTVILASGDELQATIVGKDEATDLALLKIEKKGLPHAQFADAAPLGAWLTSLTRDPNRPAVGMVSVAARPIPKAFFVFFGKQKVFLGILMENDLCEVSDVMPDMPADKAGLKAGDKILSLNGKAVSQTAEFMSGVRKLKAGDMMTLKVRRGGKELELRPVLGDAKSIDLTEKSVGEADDAAIDNLSKRRTNFPSAIQHDASVAAEECGGPLINLEGKTVGINIARYDHVCSFALPADLVQKTIVKLRGQLQSQPTNR